MGDKYKERVLKSIYLTLKKYRFKALKINNTLVIWCADAKKILRSLIKVKIPNKACKNKKNIKTFIDLYNNTIFVL